ncbi:MAG: Omp28-related outer membrane protein [Chitinophagaceae bacterium]|nr:Omp28-related outer membrane protein [Chitinophagaceae bacterium]
MKKFLLFILSICFSPLLFSQINFSDNFDSYITGIALGPQSPDWTTWSGVQGGADDINVTSIDAHSGANSLYFTSTAVNGGPADIVLPFGGPHTSGSFAFGNWMKVVSGKGAYFNFQGTNTAGAIFTLNVFFNPNGTLEITNSKNSVLVSSYPQGSWFYFNFEANLNTNTWEAFVSNNSVGTFQCADFTIASIDYYATGTTDAFYIDDVDFTYTPYTLPNLNAAASYLFIKNGLVTQNKNAEFIIRNIGTSAINSFDVTLDANGTITNQSFTGLNISSGASYTCALTNPITFIAGLNTVTSTISNVNGLGQDGDSLDDSKEYTFTPVTPAPEKIVVAEEATGTWCQWCPRGAVYLENLTNDFPGFFQGIAIHNNDPMEDSTYDAGLATKISGYPSILIDRGTNSADVQKDFLERIIIAPVAKLKNGATYNSSTGELNVSVTTDFLSTATGNYKLACVIVEDSVKGTTSGYNQSNAYAGGGNGPMGGYETKPNPVPASQMQYDHVARAIAPNFNGISNAFPNPATTGTSVTHNFGFNISNWKKEKMHIVGLLINPSGRIDNASSTSIDEAVANGYVLNIFDKKQEVSFVSVYPNPAKNEMKIQINAKEYGIATIAIIDATGKIVLRNSAEIVDGLNLVPVSLKGLATGNYFASIFINEKSQTVSFIVE